MDNRIGSGVSGLDALMEGGFPRGGVYLVLGPPGSGKTLLAGQMTFFHGARGNRAVYVTLLAETAGSLLGGFKPMPWFDEQLLNDTLSFVGAYNTVATEGLEGLLRLLGDTIRRHKATILVLDGVASAEEIEAAPGGFKKLVHDLNAAASAVGCTSFLISSADGNDLRPEYAMVDGIIRLSMVTEESGTHREIEIVKLQGTGHVAGRHELRLSSEGVEVIDEKPKKKRKAPTPAARAKK